MIENIGYLAIYLFVGWILYPITTSLERAYGSCARGYGKVVDILGKYTTTSSNLGYNGWRGEKSLWLHLGILTYVGIYQGGEAYLMYLLGRWA